MYSKENMDCWVEECNVEDPPMDCFNYTTAPVICQHGRQECAADGLESCVKHYYSQSTFLDFLICFEGENQSTPSAAASCSKKFGIDFEKITDDCLNSDAGAPIIIKDAKKTLALGTSKLGTPWVVVDGVHIDDVANMLAVVCASIKEKTGNVPEGCRQ